MGAISSLDGSNARLKCEGTKRALAVGDFMEKTLSRSSQQFTDFEDTVRDLLNAVPQPILVKDDRFRLRYVNSAACLLIGKTNDELIGSTDYDFRSKSEADRIRELDEQVLRTGQEITEEQEVLVPEGVGSLVIHHRRVVLATGQRLIMASILDTTAQRQAEADRRESQEQYRALIQLHPQMPWTADPSGKVLEIGPRWKATGFDPADALGAGWAKAIHPADLGNVEKEWSKSLQTGLPLDTEFRLATQEGGYRWFRGRAAARRADDGTILRWYGTVEDIDEERKALEALKESEARFRAIADDAPAMIWVTNATGSNDYHSRLWQETTGQTPEQAVGKGWLSAIHPDDRQKVEAAFSRAFDLRQPIRMEYRLLRPYGSSVWVLDAGQSRFAADGKFVGFVGIAVDITERRNAQQQKLVAQKQVHHMARHDALTGLPNRRYLREEFDLLCKAIAPGTKMALLCLDLDDFRSINDAHGRRAGDQLLSRVADRLRNSLMQSDILCRLGGDEFCVLRVGLNSTDEASSLARQLVAVVGYPFPLAGNPIELPASVGFTTGAAGDMALDALVQAADVALDYAKARGRGACVEYRPDMGLQVRKQQNLKTALRRAVENDELELHYQPLLNLLTGEIPALEALVRWSPRELGPVSPAEFIPVAEEAGLIDVLGEWVLRRACVDARRWPAHIGVAVNLSPLQFRNPRLAATVSDVLNATGLDGARLQLEITESVMLNDCDDNLQRLRELRELGAKIAIDDFGTGYSSLAYLRTFSFDKIKVDRSFISDLPDGRESLAIIRAVAAIGRSLGITTTVEGVEKQSQLDVVRIEGFDEAQGYLISRPLPAQKVLHFIKTNRKTFRAPSPRHTSQ
ncbi:EAL domain-containing protein (plasmid) [Ensifer adhaerens]|nr:EAL domain-containing protein [Ensifer adhaerens]